MGHALPQPRKPTASREKLGTVEDIRKASETTRRAATRRRTWTGTARSSGWRPGQSRWQPRGARARWSGRSMSCRTSRSAVGAGIALLDAGLSVGILGGRAPSWTSSRTSALTCRSQWLKAGCRAWSSRWPSRGRARVTRTRSSSSPRGWTRSASGVTESPRSSRSPRRFGTGAMKGQPQLWRHRRLGTTPATAWRSAPSKRTGRSG